MKKKHRPLIDRGVWDSVLAPLRTGEASVVTVTIRGSDEDVVLWISQRDLA